MHAIIDCFEIETQRPSLAKANAQIYSSYKGEPTGKVLVACTPWGAISFVSKSTGGCTSDKEMVFKSGIMTYIEIASLESQSQPVIMADRGFNIQEVLLPHDVRLVIPPFLKGSKQFSETDCANTKEVANSRIHIERAIGRMKEFHILKHDFSLQHIDLLDNILVIIAAIVNLQPPLLKP